MGFSDVITLIALTSVKYNLLAKLFSELINLIDSFV